MFAGGVMTLHQIQPAENDLDGDEALVLSTGNSVNIMVFIDNVE